MKAEVGSKWEVGNEQPMNLMFWLLCPDRDKWWVGKKCEVRRAKWEVSEKYEGRSRK